MKQIIWCFVLQYIIAMQSIKALFHHTMYQQEATLIHSVLKFIKTPHIMYTWSKDHENIIYAMTK